MTAPLIAELPYRPDSAALFETVADWPWAVFLDSGRHAPGQSRFDIISAQPYIRLVTRGQMTEVCFTKYGARGIVCAKEEDVVSFH